MPPYEATLCPPTKDFQSWEIKNRTVVTQVSDREAKHAQRSTLSSKISKIEGDITTLGKVPEGVDESRWPVNTHVAMAPMRNFIPLGLNASGVEADIIVLKARLRLLRKYKTQVKVTAERYKEMIQPEEVRADGAVSYNPLAKLRGVKTHNLSPFVDAHEKYVKEFPEEREPCPICGCPGERHFTKEEEGMSPFTGLVCESCGMTEAVWKGD